MLQNNDLLASYIKKVCIVMLDFIKYFFIHIHSGLNKQIKNRLLLRIYKASLLLLTLVFQKSHIMLKMTC